MKYVINHNVKINGELRGRGEIIPGEILSDEKRDWLIRSKAITCIDADVAEDVIMPAPEPMQEDEAPEIDIMAGIVTEPEAKAPAKPKTGGRSKKN